MTQENAKPFDIFATAALPYSNGPLHIGHLVEYTQADAMVRSQRLSGRSVVFVCADDNHGTAIEIKAAQNGETPEQLISRVQVEHENDFKLYGVEFDNYHRTHSPENREICEHIFERLNAAGLIYTKSIEQFYDPVLDRFLADRHIVGTCPSCGAENQYGDSCSVCGATYKPTDLKDPRSAFSEARPELRSSDHLFFSIRQQEPFLREWAQSGTLQEPIHRKLLDWLDKGLEDWDISRDSPYFGFEIPGHPGKYFYVWVDAPVGYIASLQKLLSAFGRSWRDVWDVGATAEIHHYIGKDISNFHACFWPCLLHGAGYRPPTRIFCHGFLTVNGLKMSKSTGTFISARKLARHANPEAVRYYFLALLNGGIGDIDLNIDDFVQRYNSDLVGKILNIPSRCIPILAKKFGGQLGDKLFDAQDWKSNCSHARDALAAFDRRNTASAIRSVLSIAAATNKMISDHRPWDRDTNPELAHAVLSQAIFQFRLMAALLQPIVPKLAARSLWITDPELEGPMSFENAFAPPYGHTVGRFEKLAGRLDKKDVKCAFENETSLPECFEGADTSENTDDVS